MTLDFFLLLFCLYARDTVYQILCQYHYQISIYVGEAHCIPPTLGTVRPKNPGQLGLMNPYLNGANPPSKLSSVVSVTTKNFGI